jgi:L-lactate dehydrogenase complex protein LldG
MKIFNQREKILKNIRDANKKSKASFDLKEPDLNTTVFNRSEETLAELFAKEFNNNNGKLIYCRNEKDFTEQLSILSKANKWKKIFCTEDQIYKKLKESNIQVSKGLKKYTEAEIGITSCEYLVARTGSIILSNKEDTSRTLSVYPPIHIVVAYYDQLVFDISNAIKYLKEEYQESFPSMVSIMSGPSRTADIEKTLVLGAHGPKEVYCFYINEKE